MGLFDKLKGELIDIIEWLDPTSDTMVFRFERMGNEIKNGAKLTVRESQVAVFINEGTVADVFGPGMYTLTTQNLPLLSTLKGWKYGFNSPFKAEVYFISTKQFTDQKWGTPNPIMLRDADFGVVRIRAFGTYTMRVTDPVKFLREVVGTNDEFSTDQIAQQGRNLVITRFTDAIGEAKVPVLDIAQRYDELSKFIQDKVCPEFVEYGLELTKFLISNISLPKEVEEAIDKKSSMGMLGVNYMQMQQAEALKNAANNQSGGGMEGMMGMMMAQNMMNQQNMGNMNQQVPPPPPMVRFYVSINGQQAGPFDMNTLKQMIMQGQINKESFVWKEGMPSWLPASQVPETAALFSAVPPPPPPPPAL